MNHPDGFFVGVTIREYRKEKIKVSFTLYFKLKSLFNCSMREWREKLTHKKGAIKVKDAFYTNISLTYILTGPDSSNNLNALSFYPKIT